MITNLLIIGAHKAGTSTLYDYLKSYNGQICLSDPKEPNLFSGGNRGLSESDIYSEPEKVYRCEASSSYFNEKFALDRIKANLGDDVRIIVLLRNPVERSISSFLHMAKRLDDTRNLSEVFSMQNLSASEAVEIERERIQQAYKTGAINVKRYEKRYDDFLWPFRYIENCLYLSKMNEIMEKFENVLVLDFKDLTRNPAVVASQLSEFLGVEMCFSENRIHSNKTRVPIVRGRSDYYLHKIATQTKLGTWALSIDMLSRIYQKHYCYSKFEVPESIKHTLKNIFYSDMVALTRLEGFSKFDYWLE